MMSIANTKMVNFEENEMTTAGESPPATTETTSPQTSPDPVERIQSPKEMEAEEMVDEPGGDPVIELPVTPPAFTDETPMDDDLNVEIADTEIKMDQEQDDVISEAVTEILATEQVPMENVMDKIEDDMKTAVEELPSTEEVLGTSKAEKALNCMKESAHNAVEVIGTKVTQFFGNNMRKVKSLLHINNEVEKMTDDDGLNLSNSTGNLKEAANSAKSKACTIL